jgi:hypothetical protein
MALVELAEFVVQEERCPDVDGQIELEMAHRLVLALLAVIDGVLD